MKRPNALLEIDVATISGGGIQLEGEFTITVWMDTPLEIGGITKLMLPLLGKATGRSERYWK